MNTIRGLFSACLVLAAGAAMAAEPAPSDTLRPVRLLSGTIVGPEDGAGLPSHLRASSETLARDGGAALLRIEGEITPALKRAIADAGVKLEAPVDRGAYLARIPAGNLGRVLEIEGVSWVAPYHPGLKIAPEIAGITAGDSREFVPVTVHLFSDADVDDVAQRMEALGLEVLGTAPGRPSGNGKVTRPGRIVITPSPATLVGTRESVSQWSETLWIGRRPTWGLLNDRSAWALQDGLESYKGTPLFDNGLYGDGQVVGLIDTGIDADMCYFRDPDLGLPPVNEGPGVGTPDPNQRKVLIVNFLVDSESPADNTHWDTQNHGTHVAGSVAGDDLATPGYRDAGDGMAPRAKLVISDAGYGADACGDLPGLGCPMADLYGVFDQARMQGAHIHTNSWGDRENSTPYNIYSEGSEAADTMMWDHPEFLMVFAVGNWGDADETIISPATAKNVLSVGGSGPGGASRYIPSFSSHGPTHDGRIKPDVMAPAEGVRSAWNDDNVSTNNCSDVQSTGTSMAAPTAAGMAALVRQYYVDGYYPGGKADAGDVLTPSGALLKATMIASTVAMEHPTSTPPANDQGWGRLYLDDVLYFPNDDKRLFVADVANRFASSGDSDDVYNLEVLDGDEALRVVLAWTDYPSTPMAVTNLVNDLDLEVESPSGTVYRGNVFTGGVSQTGGSADTLNPVEAVKIDSPQAGTWTVRVSPSAIPQASQGYALVATGRFPVATPVLERTSMTLSEVAGNLNGVIEPGEWFEVALGVKNTGGMTATNVRVGLQPVSAGVDVGDPVALPDIDPQQQVATGPGHPLFRFHAIAPCTEGLTFSIEYTADGYSRSEEVSVTTGMDVFLRDDLETGTGWHLDLDGTTAPSDNWVVGDPEITDNQPGLDLSPDPGTDCLYTGANVYGYDGQGIPGGTLTFARSGSYDVSGHPDALVRLHMYYYNSNPGSDFSDYFQLKIRQDSGAEDVVLETFGPDFNAPQWNAYDYRIADFVTPGSAIELSALLGDGPFGGNALHEVAIDEILFYEEVCSVHNPAPNAVDSLLVNKAAGDDAVLSWGRPPVDLTHGEPDNYRIYRSILPDQGFAQETEVPATSTELDWTDDEASSLSIAFWVIVAENPEGEAGNVP